MINDFTLEEGENRTFLFNTTCIGCGEHQQLTLPKIGYYRWRGGDLIQKAFPDLPAGSRELLISGLCSRCFDQIFSPEASDLDPTT